jgi:putative permease
MPMASLDTRGQLWSWSIRGIGLGIGLLLVVVVALVAQTAANVIMLILVAVLLASAMDPLVGAIRSRIGISRVPIILAVYIAVIVLTVVLVMQLVPAALSQAAELASRLPQTFEDARARAESLEPAVIGTTLTALLDTLDFTLMGSGFTRPDPGTIVEFGMTAADAALALVSVATMAFFWLISRETIQRFILALLPLSQRGGVRSEWDHIERRMGFWVRGQLTLMTVVGVASTLAYTLLGLPNALLLGAFAGLAEIIPIVGPAIGAIPALIAAFLAGGPELALLVGGFYVVIQVVEGNVLVPIVMKDAVGLPPFVVIASLLIGAAVAGIAGAVLAVPVSTALGAVLENVQARRRAVALTTPAIGEPDHRSEAAEERSRDSSRETRARGGAGA